MPEYQETTEIYTGRVRARACGLLVEDGKVLLIRHEGLGKAGYIWSPPGGGIQFGEKASEAVIREFDEETGLNVMVERFLFVNEYLDKRHHAVELFFAVSRDGGAASLGKDPELPPSDQILKEIRWFSPADLRDTGHENLHHAFAAHRSGQQVMELRGFFNFQNISTK